MNAFDVFSRMVETDDKALNLAPLQNIKNARKVKAGTLITIGIGGDFVGKILEGNIVGGFILVDKTRYFELKAKMEQEGPGANR